jgi:hypothetical protein
VEVKFNVRGNKKQLQAIKYWIDDETTSIVYGGAKGGGKSYLLCSLIFGDAFMYPNTRYFIARKTLADLVKHTTPSIYEVFDHWGITDQMYRYDGKHNTWHLHNGSKVLFLDAKYLPSDPLYTRFGSMQMTRGAIEEAGEFEEECRNNLFISLGRWKNEEFGLKKKLLEVCNPSHNYLYTKYYKKDKDGTLEPYKKFIQALPKDNKTMSEEYYQGLLDTLDESGKQRLIFGNWEFDNDPTRLFDYAKITDLWINDHIVKDGTKYLTADIAYQGSDIFAIGIWNGFVLEKIIAIDKIDETQVSKKINDLRLKYGIPIRNVIYDADGIRKFVVQSTKTGFLKGAKAFRNNGKAFGNDNYNNLKTQCYFKLSEMVNKNEIMIEEKSYSKQILEELEQIKKQPLEDDGKIRLEKKSVLKERLGRSPDFADMMMMRMLTEVNSSQPQKIIW